MKLPGINIKSIGNSRFGQIQQPNYAARGQAAQGLLKSAANLAVETHLRNTDTQITSAMGEAAQELSQLRAKLEKTNAIPSSEIPDDVIHEIGTTIIDLKGEERDIGRPNIFTHEVADEWWASQSNKIIQNHASRIKSKSAKAKFMEEMHSRYVTPGTLAIAQASVAKAQAHNRATATLAIQEILSSNAPTAEREAQAREIIARQMAQGADPLWAAGQIAAIGPMVDQIDVENSLLSASSLDEVNQIEEEMWGGGNRMTPDQMRTLSSQMDKRRNDFEAMRTRRHEQGGARLTSSLFEGDLSLSMVNAALEQDQISRPVAMVLRNALKEGGTTGASNPHSLSQWRQEIIKLPYTGNRMRVSTKAQLMKRQVQMATMGLNPNGTPSVEGPTLSGTDAARLIEEIDAKTKAALETPAYDSAWQMIKSASGITDMFGTLEGNQPNKNAAIAFKQALDAYMDQYGADADPVGFFNQNRGSFAPDKFEDPVNREFIDIFPASKRFMELDGNEYRFSPEKQAEFIQWLTEAAASGTIGQAEAESVAAQFLAFYRGQGVPPNDGVLALEPDHPLYRQFE